MNSTGREIDTLRKKGALSADRIINKHINNNQTNNSHNTTTNNNTNTNNNNNNNPEIMIIMITIIIIIIIADRKSVYQGKPHIGPSET